ncbi:autotransporter domain protein [Campylobacter lari RM16712]|uniref:autotransporter outer membrane beta-barrel domain-containing protein n=1 Tax=Campylobacter lari TaxID=201 RepID=UPI00057C8ECB|nr:autotransporter outer membrane beta-barrel domain-containing protein [Campylobacter lari]AJD05569.1 autotransporter domain protein [Campylobacter lari RM16712]
MSYYSTGGGFENSQSNNTSLKSSHLNNNLSFTKKTFLSLATISFLATCANASVVTIGDQASNGSIEITKAKDSKILKEKQVKNSRSISGGGCGDTTCTIEGSQDGPVTIGNGGGTLTITEDGSINGNNSNAINVSQGATNVTINNAGNVNGGGSSGAAINIGDNRSGGATINNFTNSGTIGDGSNKFAITVWGKSDSKSTIETFNNSGLIQSGSGEAIYLGNTTINDFTNSGTIKSTGGVGVNVASGTNISTLNNKGTISGSRGVSIASNSTIENLNNSNTGFISSIKIAKNGKINNINNQGTIGGVDLGDVNRDPQKAFIGTFNNNGTIINNKGYGTVFIVTSTIENFTNSGLIENSSGGDSGGIYTAGGKIGTFINENTGIIKSTKEGIKISYIDWTGTQADLIQNKGTIIAGNSGVHISNLSSLKTFENSGFIQATNGVEIKNYGQGKAGVIETLNNSGSIFGSANGIMLHGGASGSSINTITNKGTILGQSGAGIYVNGANQHIKDYIKLEGSNALIAGGTAGIINKGTIGVNNNTGSLVNNNTGNVIDLKNGATIAALSPNKDGSFNFNTQGNAILNEGTIKGNINLDDGSKIIGAINNKNIISGSISLNKKSYISSIINEKTIEKSIDLKDNSQIDKILNSGTIQDSINLKQSTIVNIDNSGTIEKGINLEKSTIGSIENSGIIGNGGIKLNDSTIGSITNNEGAKADLDLKNNSVVGTITNNGDMLITRDETSSIGKFANKGSLKNTFENKDILGTLENDKDAILEQGLFNDNGVIGTINNEGIIVGITNTFNSKTKDNKDKGYIGIISNSGTIGKEASPLDNFYGINNSGTINMLENTSLGVIFNGINNSGTINLINKGSLDTTKNNNDTKAKIYGGINNEGTMSIVNYGEIYDGITNSGTLTLSNGHVVGVNQDTKWEGGFIGKNTHGYHLENNNKGKISIDGWYFNAPEYTQSNEQRLENSIIIGGDNLGGISADKIYVDTSKLQLNTIYDANTFFADKDGNIVGDKTNNNQGVDGNNIHSLSGIYDFMGLGNGKYIANVNLSELSGKTLAKSMVYSSRLRNINISNILRDVTSKNFQTDFSQVLDMELSKKGEAYGNDADLLAELEDIFIPNKNVHANNYSFLIPYYSHSSIKIGKSIGQLSVNTTGLIGGSQRELPNDYGVIGFYLGYEDAFKEQATQRLKFDDKTYYGGLTYYGILARDGINQYYISASTRLDYTKTDIEKSYKNIPTTIESDTKIYGYGVDIKLGANYYNTLDIARISPEFGLSYYGMSNKNFSLRHIDGLKEHYLSEQFNFIDASAALKWYKPWSDKIRTNATIGAIVNLYDDAKGNLLLGQNHLSSDIKTSKYYGFGQFALSYTIANNADLSLNYAGTFTFDNTTSHTMFLKLGLWW